MVRNVDSEATKDMRNTSVMRPLERPSRSLEEVGRWEQMRLEWVGKLAPGYHFQRIFDNIPGLHFFAKNADGHLMFASRGLQARYSMRDESEILGRTDFDLNPSPMAQSYVDDDKQLSDGKVGVVERLELWWDGQGMPDWYVVTKLPLRDLADKFQGVMGVLRRPDESDRQLPVFQTVARAVEVMRRDYSKQISVAEIAQSCGQSVRQLQRRFKEAFDIAPQEFLMKTRMLASQHLLEETELTVSEIAEKCGFVDASSFIQHFRKRMGRTPTKFRRGIASDD